MRIALQYLGCRVNQAEVGEMEASLRAAGHEIVPLADGPDACIVNTCTVTSKSDMQSRQLIRKALKTGAKVLATGCYADLNHGEIEKIEGNLKIYPNSKKHYIINEFIPISSQIASGSPLKHGQRSKYFLKVQDGCDNSCTYCRIWMARGKSVSIKPGVIMESARMAESSGYREIVLTGIHLGMYGQGLDGEWGVSRLLEELLKNTSVCRFRLSSLEVGEIDDHLIGLLKDRRVCSHLHIPLQSGHDSVLRDMGRKYTVAGFVRAIENISGKLGQIGLGSDIIAGFPTETVEASAETLRLVKGLPFTYLHVFPYSARPGTKAAEMPDIAGDSLRKDRAAELRETAHKLRQSYMMAQKGLTLEVLSESIRDGHVTGTSDNYLKVKAKLYDGLISKSHDLKGRLASIRVTGIDGDFLSGDIDEFL